MTRGEFIECIDEIMCGTSNAERACLEELYDEVTKPHWISVEDELPPQGECVLVTDGKSYWQNLYSHKERGWVINDTSVTHWMHLPSVEHLKDKK